MHARVRRLRPIHLDLNWGEFVERPPRTFFLSSKSRVAFSRGDTKQITYIAKVLKQSVSKYYV